MANPIAVSMTYSSPLTYNSGSYGSYGSYGYFYCCLIAVSAVMCFTCPQPPSGRSRETPCVFVLACTFLTLLREQFRDTQCVVLGIPACHALPLYVDTQVYMYVYALMHIHIHIYIYMYIEIYTHIYIYVYVIPVYIYIDVYVSINGSYLDPKCKEVGVQREAKRNR